MRRTTNAGIEFIKRMEGVETRVYLDAVKKPTVGVGHLVLPSDGLHVGEVISMDRVDKLLRADLADAEYAVNRLVTVPLTDDQFDALVSFVFNVGGEAFSRSTLLRKLNAGDYDGAASHFADWNKAGGRPIKGLTRRRRAEADLFEGGDSAPETAKADEPVDEPTAEVPAPATGTEITGAVPTDQSTVVTTTTTTGPVPESPPQTVVNVASTPPPQPLNAQPMQVTAGRNRLATEMFTWVGGIFAMASQYVQNLFGLSPDIQKILLIVAGVLAVIWFVAKFFAARQVREIASDPNKVSVS